jgi:hypothetical protein
MMPSYQLSPDRPIHRGSLPPLNQADAELLVSIVSLAVEGCEGVSLRPGPRAAFMLASGSRVQATFDVRTTRGNLAMRMIFEGVGDHDMPEVERIHDQILSTIPDVATALWMPSARRQP